MLVRSYFFCLSSVPYLDLEEINLRKKFRYSYSIRLAFHMRGSYHLTIFVYYLRLWSRQLKSYPLSVKDLGEKKTVTRGKRSFTWIIIFSQIFNLPLLIYTLKLFKMPFFKSLRSFGHFQAE